MFDIRNLLKWFNNTLLFPSLPAGRHGRISGKDSNNRIKQIINQPEFPHSPRDPPYFRAS